MSASLGRGLGFWSKEGSVAGHALLLAPSLGCLELFLGPKVLTLGDQLDMVRAGGLGRDLLARQVIAWVYLMFVLCLRNFPPIFPRAGTKTLFGFFPARHTVGVQ